MPKTVEELQAEIEALKAKIDRAAAAADDEDPGPRGSIPAARFAEHRSQLRELAASVDGIKEQIGKTASALQSSHDAAVKKLREEHESAISAESRRAAVDLDLSDLGVKDRTIRRLIREHYDGMDEAARPESPTEWLRARREAATKAQADEKSQGPEPLPWLDAYEAHVQAQSKPGEAQRQRRGLVNTDVGAGPSGGDGLSADDVARMSPAQIAKLAGLPDPKPRA